MADIQELADKVFESVSAYVVRSMRPLVERLAEVEERQPEKGDKGESGADGVGLAGAAINRDGELLVTLSNGKQLTLGRVDGRDGLGFDDQNEFYEDDGRVLVRQFIRDGEVVKELRHTTCNMIYRDVYRAERNYVRGDVVTFGGSMWHCNAATDEKPGDGNADWTLATKRGRDGQKAKP